MIVYVNKGPFRSRCQDKITNAKIYWGEVIIKDKWKKRGRQV